MKLRYLTRILLVLTCVLPVVASAHAEPVLYTPQSSEVLQHAPTEVIIRFSERIDAGASSLRVVDSNNKLLSAAPQLESDHRTFVAALTGNAGIHQVLWSVVSADDGHFTRGSYSFAVGAGAVAPSAATSEIVTLTTTPEALGMTVELLGNGVIWAVLLLFAFAIRPLLQTARFKNEEPLLQRLWQGLMFSGVALALIGGLWQILQKSAELANLQSITFMQALPLYVGTAAGSATLWRMLAALCVGVLFMWARKKIFTSARITNYEFALVVLMGVFAYFRASISHAAANSFYPQLSIAVNFFHLVEKDVWAGVALTLVLLALLPRLRAFLVELLPRAFAMLAVDLALVSVTACYIVWLHLKSFDNLFTTQWGGAFLELLVVAVLVVALRVYHTAAYRWRPRLFERFLPATLAAEFGFALLVVYYSSVVIITSPPLPTMGYSFGFTATMVGIALLALLFAALLWYCIGKAPLSRVAGSQPWHIAVGFIIACAIGLGINFGFSTSGLEHPFKHECEADGNMWHLMLPQRAGVPTSQTPREGCMWGMGNYTYMFPTQSEYDSYRAPEQAHVSLVTAPKQLIAGVPTKLSVSIINADGTPAALFVDMEKLIHLVIVSKDETVFAHIHSASLGSPFSFNYTFPKAGEYLVSADYAHGMQLESKQLQVTVAGAPGQQSAVAQYASPGTFGGYQVGLKYTLPIAGQVETLQYTITKDGNPVTNLQQYLSAAAHVSVVKNDFSTFIHTHGEVHPPGTPLPPIVVKNGQVLHTMAMMMNLPTQFGPTVEAHLIFPTAGLYTVWGEFKIGGEVIPTSFSVRVEE